MANTRLQHCTFHRPLGACLCFLGLLSNVPHRFLGGSTPYTHVVELVSNEILGVSTDVEARGGHFGPDDLDAIAAGHVPQPNGAISAAADD